MNVKLIVCCVAVLLSCASTEAATTGAGSVSWRFDGPLTSGEPGGGQYGPIRLTVVAYSEWPPRDVGPTFETIYGFFNADGVADVDFGDSWASLNRDQSTGDYSFAYSLAAPTALSAIAVSGGSLASRFAKTTDILDFCYDYTFQGTRNDLGDYQGFNVQVKIEADGVVYYTDYQGGELSDRPKFIYLLYDYEDPLSVTSAGTNCFQFGDPGVVRNWTVQTDLNFAGNDDREGNAMIGAVRRLELLRTEVESVLSLGSSLKDKLTMVAAYLEVPDLTSACGMLNDFSRQVVAVQGKKLESELADRLVGGARDIMTSIECN